MCERCGPPPTEIKEAYDEFDEAIKTFLDRIGRSYDIMTEWVLITAQTELHTHNDSFAVGWETPLGQALYRTKGLIHETIDNMAANDTAHFLRHMED